MCLSYSRGNLGNKTSIDLTDLQEHEIWSVVSLGHSDEHTKSPNRYRLCYGGHLGKWRTKFCFSLITFKPLQIQKFFMNNKCFNFKNYIRFVETTFSVKLILIEIFSIKGSNIQF